jgi:hypothetical protein
MQAARQVVQKILRHSKSVNQVRNMSGGLSQAEEEKQMKLWRTISILGACSFRPILAVDMHGLERGSFRYAASCLCLSVRLSYQNFWLMLTFSLTADSAA